MEALGPQLALASASPEHLLLLHGVTDVAQGLLAVATTVGDLQSLGRRRPVRRVLRGDRGPGGHRLRRLYNRPALA
jgi:hypothetical protein